MGNINDINVFPKSSLNLMIIDGKIAKMHEDVDVLLVDLKRDRLE